MPPIDQSRIVSIYEGTQTPGSIVETATSELNDLVGQPLTNQTYAKIRYIQDKCFGYWSQTCSTTSVTGDHWPTGWLDPVVTTSTGDHYTVSYTGNTRASDDVWATPGWLQCRHKHLTERYARRPQKSPEQIAREAAEYERKRQLLVRDNARKKRFKESAEQRARGLLLRMLNEQQREEMENDNRFHLTVHSQDGSMRVYRIDYGFQGNVKLLGADGEVDSSYCIHSDSRLPYEDQMLAQKLLLEANEPEFLRIANKTIRRRRAA